MPQIEVTFDIDANGIVNISAKDTATGKEQKITITATSHLSDDEIERMVNEAKEHADEDKKKRESIDARNTADGLVYSTEKLLKDMGDKVPAEMKTKIEDQVKVLKKAIESDDAEQMKKETETLQNLQNELSQKLYSQAGAGDGQGAGPGAGPGGQQAGPEAGAAGGAKQDENDEEDVIDAEFEAKDEQ
jgi:molecular chaperone DnaK